MGPAARRCRARRGPEAGAGGRRGARAGARHLDQPQRLLRARRRRDPDAADDRRLPAAEVGAHRRRLRGNRRGGRRERHRCPAGGRSIRRPHGRLRRVRGGEDGGCAEAGEPVLRGGGVGTFAVQLAKALGAVHVTAVCSPRNVERVRSLGADRVVDYTRENYTRSGERYDLIVDVAGTRSWRENRRVLVPDGTLVLAGAPTGNRLTGPMARLARLWLASRPGTRKLVFFICKPNRPDLAAVRELIEAGKVRPAVDRVYPLAEIADALEAMGEGHVQGKLVVRID